MLGLSLLLPWNSLLKSLPYVMTRVPIEWKDSAPLWLTLTFTLTNCLTLTVLTLTDADSKLIKRISGAFSGARSNNTRVSSGTIGTEKVIACRLYGGLIGCSVLLGVACVTPLMDLKADASPSSMSCLLLFWGIFICSGMTMCLLQRSVYPLMSLIPGRKDLMIPAMLTGQAIAGISASMGSFLFAKNEGKDLRGGAVMALIYFGVSISALMTTVGLFHRYQAKKRGGVEHADGEVDEVDDDEENIKETFENDNVDKKFSIGILLETGKLIKPWPQLLAFNFAATLTIFPGLLTSSARSLSGNKYFIPMTFLVFDSFDLIGKVMPSMVRGIGLGPKSKIAMGFPLMRVLFLPAFLLLPNFSVVKNYVSSDIWYFLVLALMAWTSGWGNAICLINGPLRAQQDQATFKLSDDMSDRIGSLMGLSITFGCGSFFSFIIKKLIN